MLEELCLHFDKIRVRLDWFEHSCILTKKSPRGDLNYPTRTVPVGLKLGSFYSGAYKDGP